MAMSKQDFIALADAISEHNKRCAACDEFRPTQIETLAQFCQSQNYNFKWHRWLDYIAGKCGPNGGAIKG